MQYIQETPMGYNGFTPQETMKILHTHGWKIVRYGNCDWRICGDHLSADHGSPSRRHAIERALSMAWEEDQ